MKTPVRVRIRILKPEGLAPSPAPPHEGQTPGAYHALPCSPMDYTADKIIVRIKHVTHGFTVHLRPVFMRYDSNPGSSYVRPVFMRKSAKVGRDTSASTVCSTCFGII